MSVISACIRQVFMLIIAVAFLPGAALSSTPQVELSLDSAIGIALENNPRIEIATAQEAASTGVLTTSKSRFLPRLTAGADYGWTRIDGLNPVEEDNFAHGLLRISQLIWDFGRSTGLLDTSAFSLAAARENLLQTRHDIVFETKAQFYAILEKQRLITVAEQAVANYEVQLYRAQKNYEAGVRARIDVTNAQVKAAENSSAVDIADRTLSLAKDNLDLADGRYKAGIGDILEYNDAQLLYTENQSNLVSAYYTYLTALAQIERSVGIIPELLATD